MTVVIPGQFYAPLYDPGSKFIQTTDTKAVTGKPNKAGAGQLNQTGKLVLVLSVNIELVWKHLR